MTRGTVSGFSVAPGEEVLVPVGFLQTASRYWDRPLVFDPARWAELSPREQVFYPFGVGRRACVGAALGQHFLELTWQILQLWEARAVPAPLTRFRVGPLYGPPNFALMARRANIQT